MSRDGLAHIYREVIPEPFRRGINYVLGRHTGHWCRVVMNRQTRNFIMARRPEALDALEIGGGDWSYFPFRSYRTVDYPEYDVCERPLALSQWDLVIAEQVLEHVLRPYRAIRNVWQMLRPGGWFLVTTPFLIRIHPTPNDCTRWTETGLKHALAEGGFSLESIQTGSWGNRACVISYLNEWTRFRPLWHSLKNDERYPVVVWAFARKT